MGASKTAPYSRKQNSIAIIAKSFGHPARIAIIDFLTQTDHSICEDIVKVLPLNQASVAQHLKVLKDAGIIEGTLIGNAINYRINRFRMEELEAYLELKKRDVFYW